MQKTILQYFLANISNIAALHKDLHTPFSDPEYFEGEAFHQNSYYVILQYFTCISIKMLIFAQ